MSRIERLNEFDVEFYFEDDTDDEKREEVVKSVINDHYRGVDGSSIDIEEMGGTTFIAYFDALEKKLPQSVLDGDEEVAEARINALFHLKDDLYQE